MLVCQHALPSFATVMDPLFAGPGCKGHACLSPVFLRARLTRLVYLVTTYHNNEALWGGGPQESNGTRNGVPLYLEV